MERSEFERLALEHLDAVHRMAIQLTRNPADAADLVQETYLRALQSAGRFEERGGGVRPWLFTILHNAHNTRRRRESRAPVAKEDLFAADDTETVPGEPPPAWDLRSLDWEQVDERLKRSIEELNPEFRMVLLLWGVEGLKYREIAEILGLPMGTVMSRLHRVRRILGEALNEVGEELGVKTDQEHQ